MTPQMVVSMDFQANQFQKKIPSRSLTASLPLKSCQERQTSSFPTIFQARFFDCWTWGVFQTATKSYLPQLPQPNLETTATFMYLKNANWATKKNRPYFPWNTGWLIGILIMIYYNPYITGPKEPGALFSFSQFPASLSSFHTFTTKWPRSKPARNRWAKESPLPRQFFSLPGGMS